MSQIPLPTRFFTSLKRRHSWVPLLLCWVVATAMFLMMFSNENQNRNELPDPARISREKINSVTYDFRGIVPETAMKEVLEEKMPNESAKIILMWGRNDPGMSGSFLGGCPEYNCKIIGDHLLFNISSAVVFEGFSTGNLLDPMLVKHRKKWQRFVFFHQESPVHFRVSDSDLTNRNFYNMTLTYRRDADLPSPYGYTVKREKPREIGWNLTTLINKKTKLAAWFVSNCNSNSGREAYVRELQKFMPVDIYGGCGTLSCSKENREEKCLKLLSDEYKFYFAFENSICKDYITEKFWMKIRSPVVLVVLSRAIVEPFAPPNSFVAVDDFASPSQLANYLQMLHKSPMLYAKYFEWRRHYDVIFLDGVDHNAFEKPWGFCLLCKKLWTETHRHSVYSNFNSWFSQQAECAGSEMVKKQLAESHKANQKGKKELNS